MPEYAKQPLPFTAAQRWLEQKVTLPTGLNSRQIANRIPARIRGQAFFSARVASARILERLRQEVTKLAAGESDYVSARARIKTFLARIGYGVPDVGTKEDRDIQRLESTARLDLILRQNVAMAHAVGQREVSENEAVVEIFPNYRYVANTDRHARFDGLVLPKDDPFWATHYPPWEYNCQCMVIDTDEPVNGRSYGFADTPEGGQQGRLEFKTSVIDVQPSTSGYVFRSSPQDAFDDPDFSRIEDDDLRASVEAEWRKYRGGK